MDLDGGVCPCFNPRRLIQKHIFYLLLSAHDKLLCAVSSDGKKRDESKVAISPNQTGVPSSGLNSFSSVALIFLASGIKMRQRR